MELLEWSHSKHDYMVTVRRHLHEYPELSGKETETLRYIGDELSKSGIEWIEVKGGGILAFINKGKPGKCVLLRADIDALPIKECPDNLAGPKKCISTVDGVSHACGHDAHTAMLLGASLILNAMRETLNGSVILLFEQGEEGLGCIANVFRYLQEHKNDIHIDCAYGCHTRWDMPVGKLCIQPGPCMSGVVGFHVTIHGKAGHGSRPDQANSAFDCFHAIYTDMNMIRMRKISPYHYFTFSVCHVEAGIRDNTIPDSCFFEGTFRYFTPEDGVIFWNEMLKFIEAECKSYDCTFDYVILPRFLPVTNSAEGAAVGHEIALKNFGEDALLSMEPWMASESFGSIMAQYPSCWGFVGIKNEELGSGSGHHTPEFDVDEDALDYGCAMHVAFARDFLAGDYDLTTGFKPLYDDVEDLIEYCCWK